MWRVTTKITGVVLMLWAVAEFACMGVVQATSSPLLIVGIQTGTATSASQEFIELANVSQATIDLSQVRLEYLSANPKNLTQPSRTFLLQGFLLPGATYLLTTAGYRTSEASQTFSATLAASGGHLRLRSGSTEWDFVGWGTATNARGAAIPISAGGDPMRRLQDSTGLFSNTRNNAQDFTLPGDPIVSERTAANIIMTELLPDPASPATDTKDEFIELYNAGDKSLSLQGYKLAVGPTLGRVFLFTNQSLEPGEYKAFFAAETKLSLGNGGSKAQLLAPSGEVLSETAYEKAATGATWAWDGSSWQWSTAPTPNALNQLVAVTESAPQTKTTTTSAKKKTATKAAKNAQVKGASTSKVAVASNAQPAAEAPRLHNAVVAGVGSIAVLYGAYEYRNDLATIYRKLRRNRSNRREGRQES